MNGEAPSDSAGPKVVRRGRASWLTHPPAGVAHIGVEDALDSNSFLAPVKLGTWSMALLESEARAPG